MTEKEHARRSITTYWNKVPDTFGLAQVLMDIVAAIPDPEEALIDKQIAEVEDAKKLGVIRAMERIAKADRRAIFYLHFGQWVCSGALYGARDVTPEKVEKWLAGKEEYLPPPPPEPPLWEGVMWKHAEYGVKPCETPNYPDMDGWRKIKVREVRE